jgi:DNA-binding MarR family transcriptional regulator
MSEAFDDLARSIYRLTVVQRALARDALPGLGFRGLTALGVARRVGPVRVGDVAEHLGVDLSVASRLVAGLERDGYVAREPDPDDRRAHRIEITDAGTRVLREAHATMVAAFEDALGDWSESEVTSLADALARLREDFTGTAGIPASPQEKTAR